MQTVLVASSKGGAGNTTPATHLAAQFALAGKRIVLVDADPQGSSTRWCQRRAGFDSAVLPIDGTRRGWEKAIPGDTQRVVIDAPAGAMDADLGAFLDHADAVVVPIIPSLLDLEATVPFLNSLAQQARVKKGKLPEKHGTPKSSKCPKPPDYSLRVRVSCTIRHDTGHPGTRNSLPPGPD